VAWWWSRWVSRPLRWRRPFECGGVL